MGNSRENNEEMDKEIYFSKSIKAGKRIYYIDVKKNRKDEMYLALTESKKVVSNDGDESHVNFEKHKIFLYREDFMQFTKALGEAISYIHDEQGDAEPRAESPYNREKSAETTEPADTPSETSEPMTDDIKLNIEF